MDFYAVLDQVVALLQQRGRLTYGALKRQFQIDDEYLADLTAELIEGQRVAVDEGGKVLVWTGAAAQATGNRGIEESKPRPAPSNADSGTDTPRAPTLDAAERRQLTVMFCDLVDSTPLAERLDPEDLREVVHTYQETCAHVIHQYEGYIAQYLGDGLLVYFGYPVAHEDDALRAVRTGLGIVTELHGLNMHLPRTVAALQGWPLRVRIGIHTGLVVVGPLGKDERQEQMALGEAPNLAARLQGLAIPDTVVISAATYRLTKEFLTCRPLGLQALKGVSKPVEVYHVVSAGDAQSCFKGALRPGATPVVGREEEIALLLKRWEQVKAGQGQVVLLSGEPGIGKSRLLYVLSEKMAAEAHTQLECRCSPYAQHTALYPVIELLQRLLQWQRDDTPEEKLRKLEEALTSSSFSLSETMPLFAALLSLPLPERYPPPTLTPQRQREQTLHALLAWLLQEAERQPVRFAVEDLHWADPSTVEFLSLLIEQVPTARLLLVLTFRPEFSPPWGTRSYLSSLTLSRLGPHQVERMIEHVTRGKALPPEVVQLVVRKTDGVPLFVEELTKMVVETGLVRETESHYELVSTLSSLAIPSTLQDSLMARLDRLASSKEIAQLSATLGREFSYELLHAVSPLDEASLQQALAQLVTAEVLYQHGLLPHARYLFKHALIQDAAYQSLLKSTRQHYHQQIARVLEERFPETITTQPELLAHHYTQAEFTEQALIYWQSAGQKAIERSANAEAIAHLRQALTLLQTLPDTRERAQQEFGLQVILGFALMASKGWAALEVATAYTRARELCQQIGETPQLFWVLIGLCSLYHQRAELQVARELGEQCLRLAQSMRLDVALLLAHLTLGATLSSMGEIVQACKQLEQGVTLYNPEQHRGIQGSLQDLGVGCLSQIAQVLWLLGYPDQAAKRSQEALALARELSHPFSIAYALGYAARIHELRKEQQAAQEHVKEQMACAREQGFELFVAREILWQGRTFIEQGQVEEGITRVRRGLAAYQTTGSELGRPSILTWLAEAYGKVGQIEKGLGALAEALAQVDKTEERFYEAELYRLKGELTLQMVQVRRSRSQGTTVQCLPPYSQTEAEACFLKAIDVARRQQAKSLELRAVMSLSRLWQQQGKTVKAQQMLAEIYGWFTEGFDTKDLQEAKTLLAELTENL